MNTIPSRCLLVLALALGSSGSAPGQTPDCPGWHDEYRRIQAELDAAYAAQEFGDQFFLVQGTLEEIRETLAATSGDAAAVAGKLREVLPTVRRLQGRFGEVKERVAAGLDQTSETFAEVDRILGRASALFLQVEELVRARDAHPREVMERFATYLQGLVGWVEPLVARIPGLGAFLALYLRAIEQSAAIVDALDGEVSRRNWTFRRAGGSFDLYLRPRGARAEASARVAELEASLEAVADRLIERCGGAPARHGAALPDPVEAQLRDAATHCREHSLAGLRALEERNRIANVELPALARRVERARDQLHRLGLGREPEAGVVDALRAELARVEALESRRSRREPLTAEDLAYLRENPPTRPARLRNQLAALDALDQVLDVERVARESYREQDRRRREAVVGYRECQEGRLRELARENAWAPSTLEDAVARLGPPPPDDLSDATGRTFDLAGSWLVSGYPCPAGAAEPVVVDVAHRLGETTWRAVHREGLSCGAAGAEVLAGNFTSNPSAVLLRTPGTSGVRHARLRAVSHDHLVVEGIRGGPELDLRRLALILEGEVDIVAPGWGRSGPGPVIPIDCSRLRSGTIHARIEVGEGQSGASFRISEWEDSEPTLARAYDVWPGRRGSLRVSFSEGKVFTLSGQGNWLVPRGATNTVRYRVLVVR